MSTEQNTKTKLNITDYHIKSAVVSFTQNELLNTPIPEEHKKLISLIPSEVFEMEVKECTEKGVNKYTQDIEIPKRDQQIAIQKTIDEYQNKLKNSNENTNEVGSLILRTLTVSKLIPNFDVNNQFHQDILITNNRYSSALSDQIKNFMDNKKNNSVKSAITDFKEISQKNNCGAASLIINFIESIMKDHTNDKSNQSTVSLA